MKKLIYLLGILMLMNMVNADYPPVLGDDVFFIAKGGLSFGTDSQPHCNRNYTYESNYFMLTANNGLACGSFITYFNLYATGIYDVYIHQENLAVVECYGSNLDGTNKAPITATREDLADGTYRYNCTIEALIPRFGLEKVVVVGNEVYIDSSLRLIYFNTSTPSSNAVNYHTYNYSVWGFANWTGGDWFYRTYVQSAYDVYEHLYLLENNNSYNQRAEYFMCEGYGFHFIECTDSRYYSDYDNFFETRRCGRWVFFNESEYVISKVPNIDSLTLEEGESSTWTLVISGIDIEYIIWTLECAEFSISEIGNTEYYIDGLDTGVYQLQAQIISLCDTVLGTRTWIINVEDEVCNNTYNFTAYDELNNEFGMFNASVDIDFYGVDRFTLNTSNTSSINAIFNCNSPYTFNITWGNGTDSCSYEFVHTTGDNDEFRPFFIPCQERVNSIIEVYLINESGGNVPGEFIYLYRGREQDDNLIELDRCLTNSSGECYFNISYNTNWHTVKFFRSGFEEDSEPFLLIPYRYITLEIIELPVYYSVKLYIKDNSGNELNGVKCVMNNEITGQKTIGYSLIQGLCNYILRGGYRYNFTFHYTGFSNETVYNINNLTSDISRDITLFPIELMIIMDGMVADNEEVPLTGVKVTIQGLDTTNEYVYDEYYTISDGSFNFGYVPVGCYRITASRTGYMSNPVSECFPNLMRCISNYCFVGIFLIEEPTFDNRVSDYGNMGLIGIPLMLIDMVFDVDLRDLSSFDKLLEALIKIVFVMFVILLFVLFLACIGIAWKRM